MFGCQQNLISPDTKLKAILEFLCAESSKLTNCGIYYSRQILPRNGCFYLELVYKSQNIQSNVNPLNALMIDHGMDNWLINADCNGAANIGRKVATILGLDLSGVSRGELTAPLRVPLWA
ncbi:Transposase [Planktothrix agardhii]|nr:Transposase [Planktothrix agardhii]